MRVCFENVSKTYRGGVQALNNVNLEISTGMFGLIGPNGAGKTTLLRILATLLRPGQGRVTVDGFDVSDPQQKWAVKQILGYLPQELGLYPGLTVTEFLDYIATLKNLHHPLVRAEAVDRVIQLAGLRGVAYQRIRTLSGGMKRRVGIAQALLGTPKLLLVDEPTSGLDPEERVRFRALLARLAADCVVILSTHIVEDVANTCHDLAVLHLGQIRYRGSPQSLIHRAAGQAWEVEIPIGSTPPADWRIVSQIQSDDHLNLRVNGPQPNDDARPVTPTLEEAYLALMNRENAGQ